MAMIAFKFIPLFVEADAPAWVVVALVLGVMVAALLSTRWRQRAWEGRYGVSVCARCGGSSPAHAEFCARCGGKVKG